MPESAAIERPRVWRNHARIVLCFASCAALFASTVFAGTESGGAADRGKSAIKSSKAIQSDVCAHERHTPGAPESVNSLVNPLEPTPQNLLAGKTLFLFDAKPTPCKVCHGFKGNGMGVLFHELHPKPRDFTCYETMKDLSDGQMFWVIKNGAPGSRMPAYDRYLEDDQIWQLILYLRRFSEMPPD